MQIKFKDFIAEIYYIANSKCFYGEIINCKDLIVFQAEYQKDLESAFKIAVNQYCQYLILHKQAESEAVADFY